MDTYIVTIQVGCATHRPVITAENEEAAKKEAQKLYNGGRPIAVKLVASEVR
jgi:hypothetical protein